MVQYKSKTSRPDEYCQCALDFSAFQLAINFGIEKGRQL